MKNWLLILTLCLTTHAAAQSTFSERTVPIAKGEAAPFDGLLMPRAQAEAAAAILTVYPYKLEALVECQKQLEQERDRAKRFWRRPAFWIPVTCVMFTTGLLVGVWSK